MSFVKPGICHPTWLSFILISTIIISRQCAILIFEGTNIFNDSGVPVKLGGELAFLDYLIYKNSVSNAWSEITRPLKVFALLIGNRPAHVEARKQVGDWECDTVIGAKHKGEIVTMVGRKSGNAVMAKVVNKTSNLVGSAIVDKLKPLAAG